MRSSRKRKRATGPSGPSSLVELFAVIGIRGKVPTVLSCCPAEAASGASALANFCVPPACDAVDHRSWTLPHAFVNQDEKGVHRYCAALRLPLPDAAVAAASSSSANATEAQGDRAVFICFQSRWPVFSILHGLLAGLVQLRARPDAEVQLGSWVRMIVQHLPCPLALWDNPSYTGPGACREAGSAVESVRGLLPRVQWPAELDVPLRLPSFDPDVQPCAPAAAKDILTLFRLLGRECATKLLLTLLLEQGAIVLHCAVPALLVPVAEALRALMLPFHWCFAYIPLLPSDADPELTRILMGSPSPLIVGMTTAHFLAAVRHQPLDAGEQVVVVDLLWRVGGGSSCEALQPPHFADCLSDPEFMGTARSGDHVDDGVGRVDVAAAWKDLEATVDAHTVQRGWDHVTVPQLLGPCHPTVHRLEDDARAVREAFVMFFASAFRNYSLDTYWQDWGSGETVRWDQSTGIEADDSGAYRVHGKKEKLRFKCIDGNPVDAALPMHELEQRLRQCTMVTYVYCKPCNFRRQTFLEEHTQGSKRGHGALNFFSGIVPTMGFQELMNRQYHTYDTDGADGMERFENLLLEFEHMYFDRCIDLCVDQRAPQSIPSTEESYTAALPSCSATVGNAGSAFAALRKEEFALPLGLSSGWNCVHESLTSDVAVLERKKQDTEELLEKMADQQMRGGGTKGAKSMRRQSLDGNRANSKPSKKHGLLSRLLPTRNHKTSTTPFSRKSVKRHRTCTSQRKKKAQTSVLDVDAGEGAETDDVAGILSFDNPDPGQVSPEAAIGAVLDEGVTQGCISSELRDLLGGVLKANAQHLDMRSLLHVEGARVEDTHAGNLSTTRMHRELLHQHKLELWVGARERIRDGDSDVSYNKCPSCDKTLSLACIQAGFGTCQCTDDGEKGTLSRCSSSEDSFEKKPWNAHYTIAVDNDNGVLSFGVDQLPGQRLQAVDGRRILPGIELEKLQEKLSECSEVTFSRECRPFQPYLLIRQPGQCPEGVPFLPPSALRAKLSKYGQSVAEPMDRGLLWNVAAVVLNLDTRAPPSPKTPSSPAAAAVSSASAVGNLNTRAPPSPKTPKTPLPPAAATVSSASAVGSTPPLPAEDVLFARATPKMHEASEAGSSEPRAMQPELPPPAAVQCTEHAPAASSSVETTKCAHCQRFRMEIMLLKARVQVFCRVRPLNAEQQMALSLESDRAVVADGKSFGFDHVFGPSASQADVFGEVEPLVQAVTSGFNCCIFAYGQTGSGKTFTLEGDCGEPGVSKRSVRMIFDQIRESQCTSSTVEMSLLEIYNEKIVDLMLATSSGAALAVTQGSGAAAVNDVAGLTKLTVSSPEETIAELQRASQRRTRRATNMNANSSRSHLVLTLKVTLATSLEGSTTTQTGSLMICDLAGSERQSRTNAASGSLEMAEANMINKSLLALRNVVHKLASDELGHIPFRNSLLTQLLKGRLGQEGSKALMLVCASPLEADASETVSSLRFGQEVQSVKCAGSGRHVSTSDNKTIRELAVERRRNAALQGQLEKQAGLRELAEGESSRAAATLKAAHGEKQELEASLARAEKRALAAEQQLQEKQMRIDRLEKEKQRSAQHGTPTMPRVRGADAHIERLKKSVGVAGTPQSAGGSAKKRKLKHADENTQRAPLVPSMRTPRTAAASGTPRRHQ